MKSFLSLERRISAFVRLGEEIESRLNELQSEADSNNPEQLEFLQILSRLSQVNPWMTRSEVVYALRNWLPNLKETSLRFWLDPYAVELEKPGDYSIAVVNAGNIPLAGFHDFLSVLASGFTYHGKNASDEPFLLPYLASILIRIEPEFGNYIRIQDKLTDFKAVIATGSNNSARYFNHYFGKYPHIIRMNRNSVAVLEGSESETEMELLGDDIFRYFGLGCRSISKLMVPEEYDFKLFFEKIYSWNDVMQHNKYMNNFDHHQAVLLLKQVPFLTNDFLILKEDVSLASPVAILHYEKYQNKERLFQRLEESRDQIQCIAGYSQLFNTLAGTEKHWLPFGTTQQPSLTDYADGVNILEFLTGLKNN